jgi:hypothetical protein
MQLGPVQVRKACFGGLPTDAVEPADMASVIGVPSIIANMIFQNSDIHVPAVRGGKSRSGENEAEARASVLGR